MSRRDPTAIEAARAAITRLRMRVLQLNVHCRLICFALTRPIAVAARAALLTHHRWPSELTTPSWCARKDGRCVRRPHGPLVRPKADACSASVSEACEVRPLPGLQDAIASLARP